MSLKAHAFSVEALIGAEKKRKLEDDDEDNGENCFEEGNEVASLNGSPRLRTERLCASTRSCEIECASDGSRKCHTHTVCDF